MPQEQPKSSLTVAAIMTAVGLVVLVSLGTWQLQRKTWKEAILKTLAERSAAAPLSPQSTRALSCSIMPLAIGDARECEFTRVTFNGVFDHARERHVFAAIDQRRDGLGGPGYWVFTPMRLDGGGEIIINRGHVPQRLKDQQARASNQTQGTVTVIGLLRRMQARSSFDGKNDPQRNIYYVRDMAELGFIEDRPNTASVAVRPGSPDALGVFYLDATETVPAINAPVALGASPRLSNRHFEYAMTWYAFAATLLAVFLVYARQRRSNA
jgi:surfeit locus 1 family protein